MVRKRGFEPPRSCDRQPLKLVRLPFRHFRVQRIEVTGQIGWFVCQYDTVNIGLFVCLGLDNT